MAHRLLLCIHLGDKQSLRKNAILYSFFKAFCNNKCMKPALQNCNLICTKKFFKNTPGYRYKTFNPLTWFWVVGGPVVLFFAHFRDGRRPPPVMRLKTPDHFSRRQAENFFFMSSRRFSCEIFPHYNQNRGRSGCDLGHFRPGSRNPENLRSTCPPHRVPPTQNREKTDFGNFGIFVVKVAQP